ncbi:iron chelate uptake ABC transporter family permease subunit, partial [Enterobacter hormaechei]|uniref:iron chelate uptake ABC transporter family permease subunit n=1 Tax=Enterobacter hormaechei TaxID=158836 RepID=UPI0013D61F52
LGLALNLALLVGRDAGGFQLMHGDMLAAALPWRLPRVAVAVAAGAMLAVAGVLLQRLTGNPMAGPEILGIGAGVGGGVVVAMLIATAPAPA